MFPSSAEEKGASRNMLQHSGIHRVALLQANIVLIEPCACPCLGRAFYGSHVVAACALFMVNAQQLLGQI